MLILGLIPQRAFLLVFVLYPAIGALVGFLTSFSGEQGHYTSKTERDAQTATGMMFGFWGAVSEVFGPLSPVLHLMPDAHTFLYGVKELMRTGAWPYGRFSQNATVPIVLGLVFLGAVTIGSLVVPITMIAVMPTALAGITPAIQYAMGRHPAESIITAALRSDSSVDQDALARALAVDPNLLANPPSEEDSRQHRARAEALIERLNADRALIEAVIEREKAKAQAPRKSRFWS